MFPVFAIFQDELEARKLLSVLFTAKVVPGYSSEHFLSIGGQKKNCLKAF